MRRGGIHNGLISLFGVVLVAACSAAGGTGGEPSDEAGSGDVAGSPAPDEGTSARSDCTIPPGQPFQESMSTDIEEIGQIDGVNVSAAVYPHPEYEGDPWSQWGQGIVIDDGRFYSAIGDHAGPDGNSYVYEYDPATGQLTMVGDILSYVDHVSGTWGYGKVHSQMVPGPCGEIYFSTYWGTYRDIEFEGNYRGDLLFRLDPYDRTIQPLDVPVEFHGQASLGAAPSSGLIYGEAIDPVLKNSDIDRGPLFAYDVMEEEVVYVGPDEPHTGFRSVLVDAGGAAYYSIGGSELEKYDPATGESAVHDSPLPGDWLRAVTDPGPDGSVYGVTREPDTLFVMNPDGTIDDLGDALGYTASIGLSPDGETLYYMPGAHGGSGRWGSPLMAVDTETGEQETVVELHDLVASEMGYDLGGSYSVVVSPDGSTVYMGVNAGGAGSGDTFGEVILLLIELP